MSDWKLVGEIIGSGWLVVGEIGLVVVGILVWGWFWNKWM